MSRIPNDQLFAYANRLKGRVVVITGAANGIGKETATRFGEFGAKVVIGDLDAAGAQKTVQTIKDKGGEAVSIKVNVTNWEDQVAMFELAVSRYGTVDIVVPNAGVTELGSFDAVKFSGGKPQKPDFRTLDVNLTGALYTAHLAQHYLTQKRERGDLKALVFIGSIASWQAIPKGAMYTASKHAILGVMRSMELAFTLQDMRIACIHPFFADTGIVPTPIKLALAGIPLAQVPQIAAAIIYAATNPDPATSGAAWLLLDDGPVFMCPKEEFKMGVYKMIDDRGNAALKGVKGIIYWARLTKDLWKIFGKPIIKTALVGAAAKWAWDNQALITSQVKSLTGR